MTANLAGVAAAAQLHVLAAGGLFNTGINLLQITLVGLTILVGGLGSVMLVFQRQVSKGVILLIVIVWMCDVITQPTFYQGILHSIVAKVTGA